MGTGNNALILSIGAVKFDPFKFEHSVESSFHVAILIESHLRLGGEVSGSTIDWWMSPLRDKPRARLDRMEKIDIASALDGFQSWYGNESLPTWGNGATFDNVILRNAFRHIGRDCPWQFWHDCCYRTLKNIAKQVPLPKNFNEHDALADATIQAFHIKDICRVLELTL